MKALRLSVTSVAVVTLAAGLLVCTALHAADSSQTSKSTVDTLLPKDQRKAAPEFSLAGADGKPIDLANYRGKVVLLDFWATWCGGCKLEIPWYMEFDTKYKREGLAVIGVSMDEDGWKAVKPFLAQTRDPETGGNTAMKYPVVIGNDTLAKQYNLTSMPMTLLIDREGKIALSHTGVVNKDDFEGHIRRLLQ
jgi:peroxiredoxin